MAQHRRLAAVTAATAVCAGVFALSGCSSAPKATSPETPSAQPSSTTAGAPQPERPLPDPAVLSDVLNRLADPGVPGAEKLDTVQGATADQLDKFGKAITDAGFAPLTFTVKPPTWSTSQPGLLEAIVTINSPNPKLGGFAIPMTFAAEGDTWKLSKQTGELLLRTGASLAGTGAPAP